MTCVIMSMELFFQYVDAISVELEEGTGVRDTFFLFLQYPTFVMRL